MNAADRNARNVSLAKRLFHRAELAVRGFCAALVELVRLRLISCCPVRAFAGQLSCFIGASTSDRTQQTHHYLHQMHGFHIFLQCAARDSGAKRCCTEAQDQSPCSALAL